MPKIVDHDQRRAELIDAVIQLIAEQGIDSLTIRAVARTAGVSTGVVSHYFANKHEMMMLTYEVASKRVSDRVRARLKKDPADLLGCLEALLPLDRERLTYWRVWCAFWGASIGDPQLAEAHAKGVRQALELQARIVDAAVKTGHLTKQTDREVEARYFLSVIQGISCEAIFDPPRWPAAQQRRVLARAVEGAAARQALSA